MANVTFRGVLESAFENFICLRGFATLGELADASEPDESYQRDLVPEHGKEMEAFLDHGEYLFFPEVVLATNLNQETSFDEVRKVVSGVLAKLPRISFGDSTLALSVRAYRSTKDQRIRGRVVDASFTLKTEAPKFKRIDGNHRLSAAKSEKVRRYSVPFCIVLFGNSDGAKQFSRAVFHNINFKQVPLQMEHNLKLILDETPENLALFPDETLKANPSFGLAYVHARKLLPKIIDTQILEEISLSIGDSPRTFALALAKRIDCESISEIPFWIKRVYAALKAVNTIYSQHSALQQSKSRGLLAAFVLLSMDATPKGKAEIQRFTNWVLRGHLADLGEIEPESLLAIFRKLQTAKSRQVFVAMAFREETKPTYQAIQDAVADVNKLHHLDIKINPIRIDEWNTGTSYKITDEIMRLIDESGLLIADLTYGNANVYHEIGYLFGLNEGKQRDRKNCMVIWHQNRPLQKHEDAKTDIEKVDVRFDLKDFSALRFSEPNELRNRLVKSLIAHFDL